MAFSHRWSAYVLTTVFFAMFAIFATLTTGCTARADRFKSAPLVISECVFVLMGKQFGLTKDTVNIRDFKDLVVIAQTPHDLILTFTSPTST